MHIRINLKSNHNEMMIIDYYYIKLDACVCLCACGTNSSLMIMHAGWLLHQLI